MRIFRAAILAAFCVQAMICHSAESGVASSGSAGHKASALEISEYLFGEEGLQPGQALLRGDAIRLLTGLYNLAANYPEFDCPPYDGTRHEIQFFDSVYLAISLKVIPYGTYESFEPEKPISGTDFAVLLLRARDPENAASVTAETIAELLAERPGLERPEIGGWLAKKPFTQADAVDMLYAVYMPDLAWRKEKIKNSVTAGEEGATRVKAGEAVGIVLRENQSTPYRWHYRVSDGKAIRPLYDHYEYDPNPEELVGVGGTHCFYFIAETPGEYAIEFQDIRIGDEWDNEQPGLIFKLTVEAQPQQPAATPPSGGDAINHPIVGYWASTNFFTYAEIRTGNYAHSSQNTEGWMFESDGTFHRFLHTSGNRSFNGLSQNKGNYRIDGDRIYFTNVLESWKSYDNPERSYDFRTRNDFMITYDFQDNGKALSINRSNLIGDYDPDVFRTYLHYIAE